MLRVPRRNACAAVIHGRLYVVGGFDSDHYLGTIEVFDVAGGQCKRLDDSSTANVPQLKVIVLVSSLRSGVFWMISGHLLQIYFLSISPNFSFRNSVQTHMLLF